MSESRSNQRRGEIWRRVMKTMRRSESDRPPPVVLRRVVLPPSTIDLTDDVLPQPSRRPERSPEPATVAAPSSPSPSPSPPPPASQPSPEPAAHHAANGDHPPRVEPLIGSANPHELRNRVVDRERSVR